MATLKHLFRVMEMVRGFQVCHLPLPKRAGDRAAALAPSSAMSEGKSSSSTRAAAARDRAGEVWIP
jgi:hypothetical protein